MTAPTGNGRLTYTEKAWAIRMDKPEADDPSLFRGVVSRCVFRTRAHAVRVIATIKSEMWSLPPDVRVKARAVRYTPIRVRVTVEPEEAA